MVFDGTFSKKIGSSFFQIFITIFVFLIEFEEKKMNEDFGVIVPGMVPLWGSSFHNCGNREWSIQLGRAPAGVMTVFLTGRTALRDECGLAIFLSETATTNWMYVGAVGNGIPSGVFRVPRALLDRVGVPSINLSLRLQIVSLSDISNLGITDQQPMEQYGYESTTDIASRITNQLVVFVQSYGKTVSTEEEGRYEEMIFLPANYVDKWHTNFKKRLQSDPSFILVGCEGARRFENDFSQVNIA